MSKALASVDKLLIRINGISDTELKKILYTSLVSATHQLLVSINSRSFEGSTGEVEEFLVDEDTAKRGARYIPFLLRNGFVNDSLTAVSVKFALDPLDLSSALFVDSSYIKIDKVKGLVLFDTLAYRESLVGHLHREIGSPFNQYSFQIMYDYGFASKSSPEGKVYKDVPEWLQEIAIIKGKEIYQSINPSKNEPKPNPYLVENMVAPYFRAYPLALTSIF